MRTKYYLLALAVLAIIGIPALSGAPAFALQMPSGSIPAANSGAGGQSSFNWSGYTSAGGSYTGVGASWTIPQVNNSSLSADATWVGIGGIQSQDLIQTGTQAIVNQSGQVHYQAWFELLPSDSTAMPITVNGGDSVTASITQTAPSQWLITLKDNTNGQYYQVPTTYNSSLSSAEWVEEMPVSSVGGFIPLDNFGTVQFNGAYTVKNGVSMNLAQAGVQPLAMVNRSGQALATATALGYDGASFSVSRSSASATNTGPAAYGQRNRIRRFVPSGVTSMQPGSASVPVTFDRRQQLFRELAGRLGFLINFDRR